jgi:hypothetical protein
VTLQEQFIDQIAKTFASCLGTLKAKNNDYTKNSAADPFRNFRKMAEFAHIDVDQSLLSQIAGKMSRIEALTENGFLPQVDEPIEDTLKDLINYLAILKAWYEMGMPEPQEPESEPINVAPLPQQVNEVGQRVRSKIAELFKK